MVWTNTTFKGHHPVGTSAIVIAPNADEAARILNDELEHVGLTPSVLPCNMKPQPLITGWVDILNDGEY